MNWKGAVVWILGSVGAWFALAALGGLAAGLGFLQRNDLGGASIGWAAILVPVVVSIGLLPMLVTGFVVSATVWAVLVGFPPVSTWSSGTSTAILAIYCAVVGFFAWVALPFNGPFSALGGGLFAAALFISRIILGRRIGGNVTG